MRDASPGARVGITWLNVRAIKGRGCRGACGSVFISECMEEEGGGRAKAGKSVVVELNLEEKSKDVVLAAADGKRRLGNPFVEEPVTDVAESD